MASIYCFRGIYYIKYTYQGQLIRKSLRTRDQAQAEEYKEEIAARVRLGLLGLPAPHAVPTLQELFDDYLIYSKRKNDPTTYDHHELYVRLFLGPAFGHIHADQLTDRHIEDFIALLKGRKDKQGKPAPYHPETINKRLKFLGQVLRRAARPGIDNVLDKLPVNMAEHLQRAPRPLPKFITPAQFAEWWPHIKKPINRIRAVLGICTGIPDSELGKLKWRENYREDIQAITYKREKTDYEIVVYLNNWAIEAITELKKMAKGPYLFQGVKDIKKAYINASEKSGVHVTPHMLRHSFATWARAANVSLADISAILGHASVSTTQIYARVMPQFLAATTGAIDRMRPSLLLLPVPEKAISRTTNGHSRKSKERGDRKNRL